MFSGSAASRRPFVDASVERGINKPEIFSNNRGTGGIGLGKLLAGMQLHSIRASYLGESKEFARQ
jgi:acyl CoA:acetate/3-ketoacid CoA transferase alpha subunit